MTEKRKLCQACFLEEKKVLGNCSNKPRSIPQMNSSGCIFTKTLELSNLFTHPLALTVQKHLASINNKFTDSQSMSMISVATKIAKILPVIDSC